MPKRGGKSHGELGRAMVRDKDRKRRAAPTTHDKINVRCITSCCMIDSFSLSSFLDLVSFSSSLFILSHL
jgi:hypothetical protein